MRTDEAEAKLAASGVVIPPAANIPIDQNFEDEDFIADDVQRMRLNRFGYPDWRTFGGENEHQNRLLCMLHVYNNNGQYKATDQYPTGEAAWARFVVTTIHGLLSV